MTIAERLKKSFQSAALAASASGCVLIFTPRAIRLWEESLADAAMRACNAEGGIALVTEDRIVSCAPKTRVSGRSP